MPNFVLHVGDCREVLAALPEASVDAIVTDPPYEIAFMGKGWDNAGVAFDPATWAEVLRVLKPGGHLLAFGGTRTYHRMTVAIEDAGFEIRDSLHWVYGSGFPKSLSVHKATLKAVESRYGTAQCDCMDTGDGQPDRLYVGRKSGTATRTVGSGSQEPSPETRPSDVPVQPVGRDNDLCKLRDDHDEEAPGLETGTTPVLHPDVRGRRTETSGHRHSPVWTGMGEPSGGDTSKGQDVSGMRNSADSDDRSARSPSGAVPVRRDEPTGESGGVVRQLPSQDRSSNESDAGLGTGGSDARRVEPDDQGGQQPAVAWVCSWCGLPDREWLDSLQPLGTALKPAHEPIMVARKPLTGTVAGNVLEHGTGALNIDGCRVGMTDTDRAETNGRSGQGHTTGEVAYGKGLGRHEGDLFTAAPGGRWPANLVLTHHSGCQQTGIVDDTFGGGAKATSGFVDGYEHDGFQGTTVPVPVWKCVEGCPVAELDTQSADSGGASRYFTVTEWDPLLDTAPFRYVAKPAKKERNLGLDDKNHHPTVKPVTLMRWLVRLVTPPDGTVLDPFTGSGTTGMAAMLEGVNFIGVEQFDDYAENLARPRIETARRMADGPPAVSAPSQSGPPPADPDRPSLFD